MKIVLILVLAAALASCSNYGTGIGTGGTFVVAVGTEQFRVRIDNALLATKARRMIARTEQQKVVTGQLVRGDGGFNSGYHWHMNPSTIAFAEATIELCDGRPSEVEANLDYWIDTVKQFCPWSGRFTSEIGKY